MAAPDDIKKGGIVTFAVKVAGQAIPDDMSVFSIQVERHVNRIPSARIVLLDGDSDTGNFAASSSSIFVPGSQLTIEAGYDSSNKIIFSGLITQQAIHVSETMGSTLEVECRDTAIKMAVGRKSLTFSNKKDSDIISSIIGNYSGLSSSVAATGTEWPQQVQYYSTDWDFILSRAEANGLIVLVVDGKITVASPGANTDPVLAVTYGDSIYEFSAGMNAVSQLDTVKASAWDYKSQAINTGSATNTISGPGNISSKKLSAVAGPANFQLQTSVAAETADLTDWCRAQLVKSSYAKIIGDVKVDGSALLLPGVFLTIGGLGNRFNGDHFISGVTHNIAAGNWFSEISLGMSPNWFTEEPDVMAPPAAGLLPGVSGLFQGTVKKIFDDPDSQYRILVNVPLFDPNGDGLWARLTNFYSTSGAGAFFLPEVGDEVILGFLNEDPRYPVILGSVYSSNTLKPFTGLNPNEKNQLKAIVSRSGIYIQFDDVDKILTVTTPAANKMVYSDKDKKISINDQNGNSIVMSESGIDIKSPKNINIEAQQNVTIKGVQGVTVQSSAGDVSASGINIKENAEMQYSAQGGTTAQVSSGAELTIKSAMVMIN